MQIKQKIQAVVCFVLSTLVCQTVISCKHRKSSGLQGEDLKNEKTIGIESFPTQSISGRTISIKSENILLVVAKPANLFRPFRQPDYIDGFKAKVFDFYSDAHTKNQKFRTVMYIDISHMKDDVKVMAEKALKTQTKNEIYKLFKRIYSPAVDESDVANDEEGVSDNEKIESNPTSMEQVKTIETDLPVLVDSSGAVTAALKEKQIEVKPGTAVFRILTKERVIEDCVSTNENTTTKNDGETDAKRCLQILGELNGNKNQ